MEFPFGHHRHHRPGHREEEEEEARRRGERYYPPPGHNPYGPDAHAPRAWEEQQRPPPAHPSPPPYGYGWEEQRPAPPPALPYGGGEGGYVGWEAQRGSGCEPGPGYPAVQHVAHEVRTRGEEEEEGGGGHGWWHHGRGHGHGHHGGPFSFVRHVSHQTSGSDGAAPARPRTVRVYTKAAENYSLSIRDGKVILARADHNDEYQHWIKDERFSTKVKDEESLPSFALVNKVTGEAIKHSIGASHPVSGIQS